jgi:hypothetical protein
MIARMNYKAFAPLVLSAVIVAQPVRFIAQEAGKAADILSAARKAIGDKKLDALKTFSLQSALQRNIQSMQLNSDVEILLEFPDKYLRSEASSGGGMVMGAGGSVSGFNGDRPLQKLNGGGMPGGGGMVIRMGGSPGSFSSGSGEKPSAEQLAEMSKTMVRSGRSEASRFMLGWFAMAHPAINAQYTYAGEAESPDGRAYVIDVKSEDAFAARLFIDQQTHLPLMVTYKGPQPRMMTQAAGGRAVTPMGGGGGHTVTMTSSMTDEERKKAQAEIDKQIQELQKQPQVMVDYTVFFDDWRDADGMKFPFKMRRAMGSETTEEWTVSKVKVNPKIDPKRFAGES